MAASDGLSRLNNRIIIAREEVLQKLRTEDRANIVEIVSILGVILIEWLHR